MTFFFFTNAELTRGRPSWIETCFSMHLLLSTQREFSTHPSHPFLWVGPPQITPQALSSSLRSDFIPRQWLAMAGQWLVLLDSDQSQKVNGFDEWSHFLGLLRSVLFFEREAHFCPLKYNLIDQKYSVDIVNVVNDYCSWKRQILNGISR